MTIGDDLKSTFGEVGSSFTVIRAGGNVIGQYLDYDLNAQVTKPFIREYFLEASIGYDADIVAGDVIEIDVLEKNYLIMNMTSQVFENEVISKEAVLYKCNVSGELLRFSGEGWDSSYRHRQQWDTVKSDAYGLLTEKLFGTDLTQDEQLGQMGLEASILYLPSNYGAKPLDRYEYVSGEFLKIQVVEKRKFDNIDSCQIAEDTRQ